MSFKTKAINATCEGGQVSVNGKTVPNVQILSAGKGSSTGFLLISGPEAFYVAVPVETLASLLEQVGKLAQAVATGVLASNVGGPIVSGSFATDLAQIQQALKMLKEYMQ